MIAESQKIIKGVNAARRISVLGILDSRPLPVRSADSLFGANKKEKRDDTKDR
mgnify:CR=1 FL=1